MEGRARAASGLGLVVVWLVGTLGVTPGCDTTDFADAAVAGALTFVQNGVLTTLNSLVFGDVAMMSTSMSSGGEGEHSEHDG